MKRLLTYVLILGGVMLAALSGCQKEEEIFDSSRFYAYSTPISPFTATVVSYLQKQDDSTHLSVEISKRYGFPVWNKAQYVKSGNKVLLFVPLAKNEEKSVGGVWYFTQEGNSISYRVLGNNPSQAGFDQYFWMIDYFNQVLFANSVYQYKSPKPNGYLKAEASDCHIIIHCVNTYICDEFTGVHCWDEFDIIGDGSLGGGQGNDFIPPSGGPTTPADDPEPKVDTTDPSFKDTKADCVFKKLVGATATSLFDPNTVTGSLLKDFFSNKYNVKFKIIPASQMRNQTSANAETYPPSSNNEIEVWLKDSYVNSCSMVELARTLIHESIHAQIFMVAKYPNEAYSSDANFADLWKRYQDLGKQAQHNVMAESSYIAIIAKGLEEYHKNNRSAFEANLAERRLLEGFNYTEFYSNLAWYGLHKTQAFIQKMNNQDWYSKFNESLKQALNKDTSECK